jgi:hypothetical protein
MKPLNSIIAGVGTSSSPQQAVADLRPNPVHDATTLHFSVPGRSRVQIRVFDLLGDEVATLCDTELSAGEYELVWNTEGLGPGTYLCRISCGGTVSIARTVVVER